METKNTIPLWLAVAITVCVALPFGIWLGKLNVPLWAAFIVWAEYFALGAKPSALKIMAPAYVLGAIGGALVVELYMALSKLIGSPTNVLLDFGLQKLTNDNLALFVGFFVGFCILIYVMKFLPVTGGAGSLPFFNGISVLLGVFFTASAMGWFKDFNATGDLAAYMPAIYAAITAIVGGLAGCVAGWFNVFILFPREVEKAA